MEHFDLVIIGSGSGNSLIDERFAGLRVAMVERGIFGGTCLNVGCIPTKMFVLPADKALEPQQAARIGVDLQLQAVHFEQIRDRIFGRIDPISAGGKQWREQSENVTVFTGTGHFVADDVLEVAVQGEDQPIRISGDRFVLANGSRSVVPSIPGLDSPEVVHRVHTSDTVMRLPELPRSMIILGGGFIAAEFAHVFSAYGTEVTVINRSGVMLRQEDEEISRRFTEVIGHRVNLQLNQTIQRLEREGDEVVAVTRDANGIEYTHRGQVVLVAMGRVPNADTLQLENTGVQVDGDGYVVVDEQQRTTQSNVWALGDVCSPWQLKHVANHEMRVVQANLLDEVAGRPASAHSDHRFVPHAVFSDPQVAAVGKTEQQLRDEGTPYLSKVQAYGDVAYGWAMEDQHHVVKVLSDAEGRTLLGAHVMGPQASTLIQPMIQMMSFGQEIEQMVRGQYWIHPALSEVVENALLGLVDQGGSARDGQAAGEDA